MASVPALRVCPDYARDPQASDERLLLSRLATGDPDAFWALWAQHRAWLFQICYAQMSRCREDAEDVLGDVMERARESLPREADQIRNLSAWLRRMTVNACIDQHRRRKRSKCVSITSGGMPAGLIADRSSPLECPDTRFLAAETRGVITRAIESLPPRLRAASKLFFLEEAPYSAIATALSITEPNARKRIQESRGILQEVLNVEFPERREPGTARSPISRTTPAALLADQIRNSPKIAAQRRQFDAAFGSRVEKG